MDRSTLVTLGIGAAAGALATFWATRTSSSNKRLSGALTTCPATSWPKGKPLRAESKDYPAYDYAGDPKGAFEKINDMLIAEIFDELPRMYALKSAENTRIREMLEYVVKDGKMNRGLMVVESGVAIFRTRGLPLDNTALVKFAVLGWAIEWLQAWLLVADDIMDSSLTRRGKQCWYKRLGDMWYVAINDALTVEAFVYKILKRHFSNDPCYLQLLDLMLETTLQTALGQLNDTLCDSLPLEELNLERWELIVTYKTAFYSFYLSVAFAMVFAGITDQGAFDAAREILVTMGVYFQAQDDYLDCYGTEEEIGKIGTDIQDKKCGWLFAQAYHRLCNPEQKVLLDRHYGKCKVGSAEEKAIKQLYTDLRLEQRYKQYEQESYEKIMGLKGTHEEALARAGVPWEVFEKFLRKVYKRSK